ncbi:hypothetical protein JXD38_00115 [candidate division WOR-3 bacterium]|nr:hypothetical protein [candidate division WOR-3 bacterium]
MKKTVFLIVAVLLIAAMAKDIDVRQGTHLEPFMARPMPAAFRPSITKTPGHYSTTDWRQAIDSVWGEGLPTETKLQIFDDWWSKLDMSFAAFHNLEVDWDSLRSVYRAEIEDTVSRGRFAAIVSHLSMALQETHTTAFDLLVSEQTALVPGTPVLVIGGWRYDDHFGAGLTPLTDSSLLVYDVADGHPLGLQRGDIVLGYDRRPWTECLRELLDAQLPIRCRWWWGSSPSSIAHTLLISAGLNWHLFDTIDVLKYHSKDTVHAPTSLMVGSQMARHFSEQMDIPGIPKPDTFAGGVMATSGVVEGSGVGYVYSWGWAWNADQEFFAACSAMVADTALKGFIIDFRYHEGGLPTIANRGLSLLFRDTVETFCLCARSDPGDHFAMTVVQTARALAIPGNGVGYDKPIAVLVGPGCFSGGDFAAHRMTYHPRVRTFGRQTCCAYVYASSYGLYSGWSAHYAIWAGREARDSTNYLAHLGFEPDTFVWHTREAVAQGRDAVVEAAITWINAGGGVEEEPNVEVRTTNVPTIVRGVLVLGAVDSRQNTACRVELLDVSGRKVLDLHPGANDVRGLAPGVYFVAGPRTANQELRITTKVVVTK